MLEYGMLTWLRRIFTSSADFTIRYGEFGFGEQRERRAIVSSPWRISTRRLENFVEREAPYSDPWLNAAGARLLLHEEEIQITVPAECSKETLAEAVSKIHNIRSQLTL